MYGEKMERKILLVIDMQNDFVDGVLGTKEAVSIVPSVVKKVEQLMSEGYEVIFTKDTHYEGYLSSLNTVGNLLKNLRIYKVSIT